MTSSTPSRKSWPTRKNFTTEALSRGGVEGVPHFSRPLREVGPAHLHDSRPARKLAESPCGRDTFNPRSAARAIKQSSATRRVPYKSSPTPCLFSRPLLHI